MFLPLLLPLRLSLTLAAPQTPPQNSNVPLCLGCEGTNAGSSQAPLSSFYSKYSTVTSFSDFTDQLLGAVTAFIATQTYISDFGPLTATESGAIASAAATDPKIRSFTKEFVAIMNSYAATETVLPSSVRSEVASEFTAIWRTDGATTERGSATDAGGPTIVVTQTVKETPASTVTANRGIANAGIRRGGMLPVSGLVVVAVVGVVGAL
jgi:hypothetical protein